MVSVASEAVHELMISWKLHIVMSFAQNKLKMGNHIKIWSSFSSIGHNENEPLSAWRVFIPNMAIIWKVSWHIFEAYKSSFNWVITEFLYAKPVLHKFTPKKFQNLLGSPVEYHSL